MPRCEPLDCTINQCDYSIGACHWNYTYCDEGFQPKSCRGDTYAACMTSDGCGSDSCSGPIPADPCVWTDPPGGGGSSSASPSPTPVTCSYSSCNTDLNQCKTHDNQTECDGGGCSCYSNSCTVDEDCRDEAVSIVG